MNEEANSGNAQELAGIGDLAGFFAPSWTKGDDDEQVRIVREGYGQRREGRDGERRERRDGERREFRRDGDRRERRDGERDRRDGERRPRREGERREFRRDRDEPAREPVREKPLSLEVRFLPDAKALDAIIHRVQASRKAYPFRDIVRLFQKDDASLAVRIEANRQADPNARIWQCRSCSLPALDEAELAEHLLANHLGDFFEAREVEVEAPSGNFPCVARCGLTGELLGPPNHHSYAAKVRQMLRERFPKMSEAEYRSRVEMVKDPEAIEQWREAARKQTVYFRKAADAPAEPTQEAPAKEPAPAEPTAEPAPAAPASQLDECGPSGRTPSAPPAPSAPAAEAVGVSRQEAEAIFRREIMPTLVNNATHVVCKAKVLKNMPNRRLAAFLSGEFARDEAQRSQGTLARAIHAAFHHRGLRFFRVGDDRGQEFATAIAPLKFETENVTAEIRAIVDYVEQTPCCTQKALVEAVAGSGDDEAAHRVAASLRWLIEKGHVVEFFNGMLAPGAAHPVFSQTPKKAARGEARGGTAAPPEVKAQEGDAPAEGQTEAAAEAPAEAAQEEGPAAPPEVKAQEGDAPAEGQTETATEAPVEAAQEEGSTTPPEVKEGEGNAEAQAEAEPTETEAPVAPDQAAEAAPVEAESAPAEEPASQLDECGPSGRTPTTTTTEEQPQQ